MQIKLNIVLKSWSFSYLKIAVGKPVAVAMLVPTNMRYTVKGVVWSNKVSIVLKLKKSWISVLTSLEDYFWTLSDLLSCHIFLDIKGIIMTSW